LADTRDDAHPDKVILVGSLMSDLSSVLAKSGLNVKFLTGVNGLKEILTEGACAGDLMLFKASNGIGLHQVVKSLISEFSDLS
jgi:UDP-N-acetylmuramyl pentapeptide synthase